MSTDLVVTLTGADRVGIVEEVTDVVLGLGGNVETSRMARLGGEFAILMLVSLPSSAPASLEEPFRRLSDEGYKVTVSGTRRVSGQEPSAATPYRIDIQGADHEGIIHDFASQLSDLGINIESMETWITPAPVSGTPLFTMTALVMVPAKLAEKDWMAALDEAGRRANVDVEATVADAP
jgi:glycine cleavage system transcriptional repressor